MIKLKYSHNAKDGREQKLIRDLIGKIERNLTQCCIKSGLDPVRVPHYCRTRAHYILLIDSYDL